MWRKIRGKHNIFHIFDYSDTVQYSKDGQKVSLSASGMLHFLYAEKREASTVFPPLLHVEEKGVCPPLLWRKRECAHHCCGGKGSVPTTAVEEKGVCPPLLWRKRGCAQALPTTAVEEK